MPWNDSGYGKINFMKSAILPLTTCLLTISILTSTSTVGLYYKVLYPSFFKVILTFCHGYSDFGREWREEVRIHVHRRAGSDFSHMSLFHSLGYTVQCNSPLHSTFLLYCHLVITLSKLRNFRV